MTITNTDLNRVLYTEITAEISRGDNTLVAAKIATGTGEVHSYLHRYDTDTMFATGWENDFFKSLCVNVIAWHLITLANPSVHVEVIRQNYEDAIAFLKQVQKGSVRPEWPLRADDASTPIDDAGNVQWSANTKRKTHF